MNTFSNPNVLSFYFSLVREDLRKWMRGFPGGAVVENPSASVGDMGSSPGLGGSHVP